MNQFRMEETFLDASKKECDFTKMLMSDAFRINARTCKII